MITSLTRAWARAAAWLLAARASSRASRMASWCASRATRNSPVPARPVCTKRVVSWLLRPLLAIQASSSSTRVTEAAVPSASVSGPRMAPSSTGSANSGV